jgi:hypothetical protein
MAHGHFFEIGIGLLMQCLCLSAAPQTAAVQQIGIRLTRSDRLMLYSDRFAASGMAGVRIIEHFGNNRLAIQFEDIAIVSGGLRLRIRRAQTGQMAGG